MGDEQLTVSLDKSKEINKMENVMADHVEGIFDNNIIAEEENVSAVKNGQPSEFVGKALSKEFLADINILAGDNNKASAYFKPVINAARMVSEAPNDKLLSIRMSDLLAKAMSYLENRGASKFSRQRNNRRAACRRVVDHIGKFLYDAPPEYSICVYNSMDEKLAKTKVAKDFVSDFGYYLEEDHIRALDAELKLREFNKKNKEAGKKETGEEALVRRLEGIRSLMTNTMPPYPGDGATKQQLQAYNDEITATGLMFQNMYESTIELCDKLIQELPAVHGEYAESIKSRLVREQRTFSNNISGYLAGHKPDGTTTWKDALAARCGETISISGPGVYVMGKGTSIVYRVNSKNGVRRYFKKEEELCEGPDGAWQACLDNVENIEGYEKNMGSIINKLDKAVCSDLKPVLEAEDYEEAEMSYYNDMIENILTIKPEYLVKSLCNGKVNPELVEKYESLKYLKSLATDPDAANVAQILYTDFLKAFNLSRICKKRANIDAGKKISVRNVATSRMATLLGMDSSVAKSETVEARQGNKTFTGNAMYEADGVLASDAYSIGRMYTTDAISQLSAMMVFDSICGQIDRNTGNYFVKLKGGKITGFCMIDNDISFGKIGADGVENGVNCMRPLSKESLYTLPSETKKKIRQLGELSKDHLRLFFKDLIDDDEIDCLKERIDIVNRTLDEADKSLEEKKKSENEDERFVAEMMADPEFATTYYQKCVYVKLKKIKKELKAAEMKIPEKNMILRSFTYLNPESMLPEDKVYEKLDKFKEKWKKSCENP